MTSENMHNVPPEVDFESSIQDLQQSQSPETVPICIA